MGWKFDLFGDSYSENDLTLDQYIRLEDALGVPWGQIHPLRSAKQAVEIAAVMYSDRHDLPFSDAMKQVRASGAVEFVETLTTIDTGEEEVDPPEAGSVEP